MSSNSPSNDNKTNTGQRIAIAMMIGIAFGLAIGAAFDQTGVGMAIGAGLGVTFAIIFNRSGGDDGSAR